MRKTFVRCDVHILTDTVYIYKNEMRTKFRLFFNFFIQIVLMGVYF